MPTLLSRWNSVSTFRIVIVAAALVGALASDGRATDHVTPNGSYQTVFEVPPPPAPGAPRLALTYDSAASSTLAGIGWDVSVGWPTSIIRDVRFGTPQWKRDSSWLWGSSPLIPTNAAICQQTGVCQYRLAPDSLITATIDLAAQSPNATVTLPSGITLEYAPIIYDGMTYPAAPAGAETNVLGFLLSSATERNGFQTCFRHKHLGDRIRGNMALLEEIAYGPGPTAGSCSAIFSRTDRHRIVFEYEDLKQAGYFFTWTLRFGAPVSFGSLLKKISIYARGIKEYDFVLVHDGTLSETRRPRLVKIQQESTDAQGGVTARTLRSFSYGDRSPQFLDQTVLDLGPLGAFPPSLTGAVSRPIRRASIFGSSNVFQVGQDQDTDAAPPSHATTEQWSFIDLNGDGLPDFQWGKETGSDPAAQWGTFETPPPPFGPTVTFAQRPAQQQIMINDGIAAGRLFTSMSRINSHAPTLESNYAWVPTQRGSVPIAGGPNSGFTSWIWLEGRGQTRSGMPVNVSAPEIANPAPTCPPTEGQDTRLWPVYPDGTFGGSHGSIGQSLQQAAPFPPGGNKYFGNPALSIAQGIFDGYHPTYSISSTLSGWADLDGDGLPEFIATPASIERFSFDFGCTTITDPARFITTALQRTLDSLFARQPFPATTGGQVDTSWHVGKIKGLTPNATNGLNLTSIPGPPGPASLPLSYDISTGTPEGFGFTLPVGSLASATISSIINNSWIPIAAAAPGLTVDSFTPRSTPGYTLTIPAPSASAVMQGLGNVAANNASGSSIGDFIMSLVKVNFDLTFASTANTNRSETRAQLMDINADGLPDYLLYNSGTLIPGATPGSLVAYVNSPTGFGGPTVINSSLENDSHKIRQNSNNRETAIKRSVSCRQSPPTLSPFNT